MSISKNMHKYILTYSDNGILHYNKNGWTRSNISTRKDLKNIMLNKKQVTGGVYIMIAVI